MKTKIDIKSLFLGIALITVIRWTVLGILLDILSSLDKLNFFR